MLGKIFDPFVKASPVSVMAQGLMERILHPERLDACFDGLESAQYTREFLFSSVFNRMNKVVCGSQRSVHAAYQAAVEGIGVSIVSVYNKLNGLEVSTSAGLVRYAVADSHRCSSSWVEYSHRLCRLEAVLPTVIRLDVWLGDRNFCTRDFLHGSAQREAYFVIREHPNLPWKAFHLGSTTSGGQTPRNLALSQYSDLLDGILSAVFGNGDKL
jgi:hypothetical protein